MQISYDPAKRDKVLAERGLDFAQAGAVFAGLVVIVWAPRDGSRRIIAMRHAHDREEALWRQPLG